MASGLTPMMQQYMQIKEENPGVILMYRLGDFYEMFFDDAKIAAKELNLVLTGRDCGLEERAPMCGVPHHALQSYVGQLIAKGYRVAICEQLEDPKAAKGLVRRGITRLITPGTVVEEGLLADNENNFLMSIERDGEFFGTSWCDVSTGEFRFRDFLTDNELMNEIERLQPREFLIGQNLYDANQDRIRSAAVHGCVTPYSDWAFRRDNATSALLQHFGISSLRSFDIEVVSAGVRAAGALIRYLHDSQKNNLAHISGLKNVRSSSFMTLDAAAIRNLELVRTLINGSRRGSLLGLMDRTRTPSGSRMLKKILLEPLRNKEAIERRHEAVEALMQDTTMNTQTREILDDIKDLERILSKLSYGTANASDCVSLRRFLELIPRLRTTLEHTPSTLLRALRSSLNELPELRELLEHSISDNPTGTVGDGSVIRPGYSSELDELTALSENGTARLSRMEQEERERTGIKSLKIRYNRVFGYFIEVSRAFKGEVPENYIRRQTLANAERYVTDELKELEEMLLSASEKRKELEQRLFNEVCAKLAEQIPAMQQSARSLAMLDVLQSFAAVAYEHNFVRPIMTEKSAIRIRRGRHPVVESMSRDGFVPNDLELGVPGTDMMLITGPNMAGKSTYMRQTGIIVLLAHIGSFVPADSAEICLVDRIFTRVGASDDLASGQSTFMVEMNELANILNNATENSLVILDEVGRGTGTADGLAIAKAAAVHILTHVKAKTMFATHYHELISMADEFDGIMNRSVAVKEVGNSIVFLHQIVDGGTNKSFGIEVAKLAGVPEQVTSLASRYLATLNHDAAAAMNEVDVETVNDMNDEEESSTIRAIKELNPDTLAPLEALSYIYKLKEELSRN